jgi:hypothetical protein
MCRQILSGGWEVILIDRRELMKASEAVGPMSRQRRRRMAFEKTVAQLKSNRSIFGPGDAYQPGVTRQRVRKLARKMAKA